MALNINEEKGQTAGGSVNQQTSSARPARERGSDFNKIDIFQSGADTGLQPIVAGSGADDYLNKLLSSMKKICEEAKPGFTISLVPVDRNTFSNLSFSAIAVAVSLAADPSRVAFYTVVAGATGELLQTDTGTHGDERFEIGSYHQDALNDRMRETVREALIRAFPGVKVFDVDGVVLMPTFDPELILGVSKILAVATQACNNFLKVSTPGFNDYNLANSKVPDTLTSAMTFGQRNTCIDAAGMPVRADVLINYMTSPVDNGNNRRPRILNENGGVSTISSLMAYVDLVYTPPENDNGLSYSRDRRETQYYTPRVIVTDFNCRYGMTPALSMLSFTAALSMIENTNWMQAYRPDQSIPKGEIDFRDIAALAFDDIGIDPEDRKVPDIKSADTSIRQVGEFISRLVRQVPFISLDIPDAGPSTWYTSVFANVLRSNAAYNDVYEACLQLTNGRFGELFPRGRPIIIDEDRYLAGYWTDQNGNLRDVRDIDLLAICNLKGETDPEFIRDWSDAVTRKGSYPVEQRIDAQKKMIMAVTRERATFTGLGTRVTFSGEFLTALSDALRDCSFIPQITSSMETNAFRDSRGTGRHLSAGLMNDTHTFMVPARMRSSGGRNYSGSRGRWRD